MLRAHILIYLINFMHRWCYVCYIFKTACVNINYRTVSYLNILFFTNFTFNTLRVALLINIKIFYAHCRPMVWCICPPEAVTHVVWYPFKPEIYSKFEKMHYESLKSIPNLNILMSSDERMLMAHVLILLITYMHRWCYVCYIFETDCSEFNYRTVSYFNILLFAHLYFRYTCLKDTYSFSFTNLKKIIIMSFLSRVLLHIVHSNSL